MRPPKYTIGDKLWVCGCSQIHPYQITIMGIKPARNKKNRWSYEVRRDGDNYHFFLPEKSLTTKEAALACKLAKDKNPIVSGEINHQGIHASCVPASRIRRNDDESR